MFFFKIDCKRAFPSYKHNVKSSEEPAWTEHSQSPFSGPTLATCAPSPPSSGYLTPKLWPKSRQNQGFALFSITVEFFKNLFFLKASKPEGKEDARSSWDKMDLQSKALHPMTGALTAHLELCPSFPCPGVCWVLSWFWAFSTPPQVLPGVLIGAKTPVRSPWLRSQ